MEKATKLQVEMVKQLGLEKLVPLDISPEGVDSKVLSLKLAGKISDDAFTQYWFSDARQSHTYVPTVWSTIKNIFDSYL